MKMEFSQRHFYHSAILAQLKAPIPECMDADGLTTDDIFAYIRLNEPVVEFYSYSNDKVPFATQPLFFSFQEQNCISDNPRNDTDYVLFEVTKRQPME